MALSIFVGTVEDACLGRTVEDACPYTPILRANRYEIYSNTIVIKTLISRYFSLFKFIHFHHPSHYITNRQRKQVLCRNSFVGATIGRPFLFCVFQRAIRESPLQNTNIIMRTSLSSCFLYCFNRRSRIRGHRERRCRRPECRRRAFSE